jgi:hypothetical protein
MQPNILPCSHFLVCLVVCREVQRSTKDTGEISLNQVSTVSSRVKRSFATPMELCSTDNKIHHQKEGAAVKTRDCIMHETPT